MIKTKAIRKIFITTVTMFVLLTVFSIPMLNEEDALRVNFLIEEENNIDTNNIYLLSENGYLVKSKILFDNDNLRDKVLKVLNNLIENEIIIVEPNTGYKVNNISFKTVNSYNKNKSCAEELFYSSLNPLFLSIGEEDEQKNQEYYQNINLKSI